MNASLITIGNEVLNGQVVDTNAAWIAQELLSLGISVKEKWSVADEMNTIVEALERSHGKADVIITTGGLGPTADDLTCEALAQWMQVERLFHEDTWQKMIKIFASFNRAPTESHKIQCMLPAGVTILSNAFGTAPGMYFHYKQKHVISLPGVPFEMKGIFDPYVKKLLESVKSGPRRKSHTFNTAGEGETFLEDQIREITSKAPDCISFAYLPDIYKVRIRVDLDSDRPEDLDIYQEVLDAIRLKLKIYIVGENETTLELAIGNILKLKGWMLGIAESCTGGYISHLITSNAGSSEYFQGSIISYAYELKENLLGVRHQTLETFGAVSEETVIEMAQGALRTMNVQVSISISGIAGPGGGTKDKPVGLIWLAIADHTGRVITKKINRNRDRLLNIKAAANMALITLYRFISDAGLEA